MVKRWPTQRIALLCGAPLGFFSGLLLADPDDSSIYNVVGECIGAVVVGVLLVGVVCAGRNWMRGCKVEAAASASWKRPCRRNAIRSAAYIWTHSYHAQSAQPP
jgi:hypothetical protein